MVWTPTHWVEDKSAEIVRRAKETARSIFQEASNEADGDERKAFVKWAKTSEGAARIKAMIELAQSDPSVSMELSEFDKDLMALNLRNGTLNLATGRLRAHGREDLISKLAPVDYLASAPCPRWRAFLDEITVGRTGLASFLQRAVGYALTGSTREQVLFLLLGPGANGKSTFLEVVRAMLGDYSAQSDFSTLLCGPEGRARNDIARLVGKRFVTAVEVGRGQTLSEVVAKQLTGGDTIAARYLFCESFEYVPQFKLFLAANHSPSAPGDDDALWRRILVVPFDAHIPPERRDKSLLQELREELPGILSWAVEGCLVWQREGLNPPREVLAASGACRREHDSIGAFLTSDCVLDAQLIRPAADLYAAYREFCSSMGFFCESQRKFGLALRKLGLRRTRQGATGKYAWIGIGIE
jgi:putative DNA primase/helicase